ncbi:DUF2625 family protein [Lentzea terrae]|uniref:DUF2625 family protein n=1 Tax=Lentzea terrae TaxID=2200761 RepID=UPI000DD4E182|nr:DUF2625 family protein [Lentzea terrae]
MFWPGWQTEVAALGMRSVITMWPPLFSKESAENVAGTTRSAVPLRDQLSFQVDFAGQFGLAAPGPLGEV